MRIRRIALLLCSCVAASCVSYDSYDYLKPVASPRYQILEGYHAGVYDQVRLTEVYGVGFNVSGRSQEGEPLAQWFALHLPAIPQVYLLDSALRVSCAASAEQLIPLSSAVNVKIQLQDDAGAQPVAAGDWLNDMYLGAMSPSREPKAMRYFFKVALTNCDAKPLALVLPRFMATGEIHQPATILFQLAHARVIEPIPVQ